MANDEGYEHIYSQQLKVKANSGDVLIVLSGSGNSPNVIKALESSDIEIQRIGASLVQNAPEEERKKLGILVHRKVIDGLKECEFFQFIFLKKGDLNCCSIIGNIFNCS